MDYREEFSWNFFSGEYNVHRRPSMAEQARKIVMPLKPFSLLAYNRMLRPTFFFLTNNSIGAA